jgi:putative transposase
MFDHVKPRANNERVMVEVDAPFRGPYRKRCRRENVPGHAHALTFSCFKRQPFFSGERARQWFIDALNLARSKHGFDLWAFVIMPEHVHLLIWPTAHTYAISAILATLKQSVTRRAGAFVQERAPTFLERMTDRQPGGRCCVRFWQRGGLLRGPENRASDG